MQHSNAQVPTDQSKYSQYRAILVCDHNGAGARNAITGWEDFILNKKKRRRKRMMMMRGGEMKMAMIIMMMMRCCRMHT